MENTNQRIARLVWPDLIVILVLAGTVFLTYKAQTPIQVFVLGLQTGLLIVYFMAFIYKAGQIVLGKRA